MRITYYLLLATYCLPLSAYCSIGTTVFDFLRIPTSARLASMGDVGITLSGEVSALFSNPAGLFNIKDKEFSTDYTGYVVGIHGGCISYAQPFLRGVIGTGINYIYYGKFEKMDNYGNSLGNFTPQSLVPSVGYARLILPCLSAGVSLKIIYQNIDEYQATGIAIDAGAIYYPPKYEGLAIGMVCQNLGIQTTVFNNEREALPITLRIGAGYTPNKFITLVFNVSQPIEAKFGYNLGVEWKISDLFTVRGGYYSWGKELKSDSPLDLLAGLTFGAGFTKKRLRLDYGLTPEVELGFVHRISLSWKM